MKSYQFVSLMLVAICGILPVSCGKDVPPTDEQSQYDKCMLLAEEYAKTQIAAMTDQQRFWGERFGNSDGNFTFLDARVDTLTYELTARGHLLYRFGCSTLPAEPDDIFEANGWR